MIHRHSAAEVSLVRRSAQIGALAFRRISPESSQSPSGSQLSTSSTQPTEARHSSLTSTFSLFAETRSFHRHPPDHHGLTRRQSPVSRRRAARQTQVSRRSAAGQPRLRFAPGSPHVRRRVDAGHCPADRPAEEVQARQESAETERLRRCLPGLPPSGQAATATHSRAARRHVDRRGSSRNQSAETAGGVIDRRRTTASSRAGDGRGEGRSQPPLSPTGCNRVEESAAIGRVDRPQSRGGTRTARSRRTARRQRNSRGDQRSDQSEQREQPTNRQPAHGEIPFDWNGMRAEAARRRGRARRAK